MLSKRNKTSWSARGKDIEENGGTVKKWPIQQTVGKKDHAKGRRWENKGEGILCANPIRNGPEPKRCEKRVKRQQRIIIQGIAATWRLMGVKCLQEVEKKKGEELEWQSNLDARSAVRVTSTLSPEIDRRAN